MSIPRRADDISWPISDEDAAATGAGFDVRRVVVFRNGPKPGSLEQIAATARAHGAGPSSSPCRRNDDSLASIHLASPLK
jgi:hypothetical protein